jgi:hypothetical protein
MALTITVDGNTLPHRVRLNDGTNNGIDGLTSAADGSGSMGGIIIDDPNHDLVLQGWQTVTVEESDCTTAPRLFTGFIGDRTTTHGNYPTDGGRQVNVTLYDQNVLLTWALITGADGKRPEESRTARIDWLLGSDYLDTIVFDTGFVVPGGTSDFQEADYRGQYPRDVLDDVLGAFQVAFAFWDEAADKVGLFYDAMTATTRDSTLTISNDPDDQDFSTCWPPYVDAELAQDPSEVYSLERLTYTNGLLLRTDPTTKAQFFPSPYPNRGQATDRSRIGKAQTASDYINALLAQASAEKETVTCTLLLPSTHVGLVDAGQRISVKFVHLDGYEDFVYTRITSRTTRQALGRSDLYEVQLTLNQRGPFGGGGGGGGSNPPPSNFPPPPSVTPSVAQTVNSIDVPNCTPATDWAIGSIQWGFIARRGGGGAFRGTGWVFQFGSTGDGVHTQPGDLYKRTVVTGDTKNGPASLGNTGGWYGAAGGDKAWIAEVDIDGATSFAKVDTSTGTSAFSGGTVTTPSGSLILTGGALGYADTDEIKMATVGPGVTQFADPSEFNGNNRPWLWGGFGNGITTVTGTIYDWLGIGATSWGYSSVSVGIAPAGTSVAPSPGQQNIRPEVVTMTGPDGTTLWPFADGTLHVFVDDVEQTAKLVSQDGATGDFTLGFTPTPTEVVTVEYVGR